MSYPVANGEEVECGTYGNKKLYCRRFSYGVNTLATSDTTIGTISILIGNFIDYTYNIVSASAISKDYYSSTADWFRLWFVKGTTSTAVHIKQGTAYPTVPYTVYLTVYYVKE